MCVPQSGQWQHISGNGLNSSMNSSGGFDSTDGTNLLNASLSNSPARPPEQARARMPRPRTLLEKARMNVGSV